jgi:hypothetical protein
VLAMPSVDDVEVVEVAPGSAHDDDFGHARSLSGAGGASKDSGDPLLDRSAGRHHWPRPRLFHHLSQIQQ